jgi:hypothetical protein
MDILELEKIKVDPRNGNALVYPQDAQLYTDYIAVVSWLQGYLAGAKANNPYHGPQVATWLFSFCRANPSADIVNAASSLAKSLSQSN